MKTYTFKIKVDSDKVVVAVNMQLEQFYDSVKMTKLEPLVERYPEAYITASDYYYEKDGEKYFVTDDYAFCQLSALLNSKDLKSFLMSKQFLGFYGDDDFDFGKSTDLEDIASKFIEAENKIIEANEDNNAEILKNSLAEDFNDEEEEEEE